MTEHQRMIPPERAETEGLDRLRRALRAAEARSVGVQLNDQQVRENEYLGEMMAVAVAQGMRLVMEDKKIRASFWEAGFEAFTQHAARKGGVWFGKQAFTAALIAIISAAVLWILTKNGK